jgi:hypothetical protein
MPQSSQDMDDADLGNAAIVFANYLKIRDFPVKT